MIRKEEPKELPYSDEEAKEFASKVSHEWWQMVMDKWNTLTEDEKRKYNQYIGFNDFSDHLMNILRSVLLGLKRNGKLIYEEGSLFSEPDQKPTETDSSNCTNKYVPKLKVGDKACLSDKNGNIYFEEILKANDEEYYTKTFGWINCKAIDKLHEINFKEYNKPFTINDFKIFNKVLWRLDYDDIWAVGFFDSYRIENNNISYYVIGCENWVPQCVPYNIDTAYLHDTKQEYNGKYKTW